MNNLKDRSIYRSFQNLTLKHIELVNDRSVLKLPKNKIFFAKTKNLFQLVKIWIETKGPLILTFVKSKQKN